RKRGPDRSRGPPGRRRRHVRPGATRPDRPAGPHAGHQVGVARRSDPEAIRSRATNVRDSALGVPQGERESGPRPVARNYFPFRPPTRGFGLSRRHRLRTTGRRPGRSVIAVLSLPKRSIPMKNLRLPLLLTLLFPATGRGTETPPLLPQHPTVSRTH